MTATQDHVGIRYASVVLARGILNGVVNVTMGAYNFDPDVSNPKLVNREPVVVDRLRMDVQCAHQLYQALGEVLNINEPAAAKEDESTPPKANGEEEVGLAAGPKLN